MAMMESPEPAPLALSHSSIYHSDTMDTAKLWFTLLCVCGCWILSLAINCDWTTEYDYEERCCKACPLGEYPKVPCPENNTESVCEKCSTAVSAKDKCFCKDNHLCFDDKCGICKTRERCKPGHQLKRTGAFDYWYFCEPCPNNTYNDAEDSTCKSITKCVGGEIFPGNKTHNAICVSSGLYFLLLSYTTHTVIMGKMLQMHFSFFHSKFHSSTSREREREKDRSQTTHSFMLACLAVTVLTCLVFIMYTAFQIFKYKMLTKISKPCTHRMVLPSDTCSCKLSKEEKGEDSEDPCKHDVHSFP
ncbi:tumor necrosis factor receptor superfamily member 18-like [Sinocyclocheilus rhinocerous]|uniref:tumor necrosis factor receptor superfamily member 18-like n=1 Tax=Sinocyclocheilus rhinocerous TaxID=307959 RepID=UPI0007B7A4CF|nr:PREDICTED: tumor necrosis factor receptor superfamily member 18-like [Sinocyclocheilus rhinocerous]